MKNLLDDGESIDNIKDDLNDSLAYIVVNCAKE